jgi:hypothetical protein
MSSMVTTAVHLEELEKEGVRPQFDTIKGREENHIG